MYNEINKAERIINRYLGYVTVEQYFTKEGVFLMATIEHIKSLVKAHKNHDNEQFRTVVLQIAAHEAKNNHENNARDLKKLIENINYSRTNIINLNTINPMLNVTFNNEKLNQLIVAPELYKRIYRILDEFRQKDKLQKYGVSNRRKILIEGSPGTGKTFTASIIASELDLPLYTVQMDKLVTKFMGETSVKLREIFDSMQTTIGVYLFDEFDAIGADRNLDNEVGEMRRILNSFLQFIEEDSSMSVIIAATNNHRMLDKALFRRFDDVLHYSMPSVEEVELLFNMKLSSFNKTFSPSRTLIKIASELSHAEIIRICDDAIKSFILQETPITEHLIKTLIHERVAAYNKREA